VWVVQQLFCWNLWVIELFDFTLRPRWTQAPSLCPVARRQAARLSPTAAAPLPPSWLSSLTTDSSNPLLWNFGTHPVNYRVSLSRTLNSSLIVHLDYRTVSLLPCPPSRQLCTMNTPNPPQQTPHARTPCTFRKVITVAVHPMQSDTHNTPLTVCVQL